MSLKYVPPNAPSLITLMGILFVPKFIIHNEPLTSHLELFSLLMHHLYSYSIQQNCNGRLFIIVLQHFLTQKPSLTCRDNHHILLALIYSYDLKIPIMTKAYILIYLIY